MSVSYKAVEYSPVTGNPLDNTGHMVWSTPIFDQLRSEYDPDLFTWHEPVVPLEAIEAADLPVKAQNEAPTEQLPTMNEMLLAAYNCAAGVLTGPAAELSRTRASSLIVLGAEIVQAALTTQPRPEPRPQKTSDDSYLFRHDPVDNGPTTLPGLPVIQAGALQVSIPLPRQEHDPSQAQTDRFPLYTDPDAPEGVRDPYQARAEVSEAVGVQGEPIVFTLMGGPAATLYGDRASASPAEVAAATRKNQAILAGIG